MTNIIGFLKGYAYSIEIVKVFDPELELSRVFGIKIAFLEERNKAADFSDSTYLYPICTGPEGIYARRCFADLNMAMKHPDDTAFYCYRALESLKQYFGNIANIDDDRQQWQAMANVIGGSKEDVDPIRLLAFPARHGLPKPMTNDQWKEVFQVTWRIVERFCNYRLEQLGEAFRLPSP